MLYNQRLYRLVNPVRKMNCHASQQFVVGVVLLVIENWVTEDSVPHFIHLLQSS